MQQELRELLSSSIPRKRQQALNRFSHELLANPSPSKNDINGFSALLLAVYEHDPDPAVRAAAIEVAFSPSKAIEKALLDAHATVRSAALRKLRSDLPLIGSIAPLFTQLLVLISVHNEEHDLLDAMETLTALLHREHLSITANQILSILGQQDASGHSVERVLDRCDSFGVLRHLTEHDSPAVRSAILKPLHVIKIRSRCIAKRKDAPLHFAAQSSACCFSILEELLQDVNPAVQMGAVHASIAGQVMVGMDGVPIASKLSEKSAKSLLRLIESLVADNKTCGSNEMEALAALKFYPLATLSAYGLVETFLRRRLQAARISQIQNQRAENTLVRPENRGGTTTTLVSTLEITLREIIRGNPDFARVFDLNRSLSDRHGQV